jgi:hypothetical protein
MRRQKLAVARASSHSKGRLEVLRATYTAEFGLGRMM